MSLRGSSAMEGKFEVNRLERPELEYELAVRGFSQEISVGEMRKKLRSFLKLEKSSEVKYPPYPFSFKDDCTVLTAKLAELKKLIEEFSDVEGSGAFLKISSKLLHSFGRATRSVPTTDEEGTQRTSFLVDFLGLQSELRSRSRRFRRSLERDTSGPLDMSALSLGSHSGGTTSEESSEEDTPPVAAVNSSLRGHVEVSSPKSVPVSKWNFKKFTGDCSRMSLSAFLEEIEELRISRNVTKEQLLHSAADLFADRALIWYRSMRSKVTSWSQLVSELRVQFQPSNFNDKLFEEIKRRTQGPSENMGMYIAIMNNMFNRLTVQVSERTRLAVLLKNISPFYQAQLGLVTVDSVDQLLELGRKLEARKATIETFTPPPRSRVGLMEPDLAYVYGGSESGGHSSTAVSAKVDIICWNCQQPGHRSNECSAARKKHCFRCGTEDVTVRSCPKCNRSTPNEIRRQ